MDEVARRGVVGREDNVPAGLPSGSDVATMSLFGYDPLQFHTGRGAHRSGGPGNPPRAGRLGHSLQPGDRRGWRDEELHGRAGPQRRRPGRDVPPAVGDGESLARVPCRRQLP